MNEPTRIHLPQGFVPAGTRLSGIYEIDSPLAKGGMGEVYRGHTIETGDPVAIKLIRSDMADNEAVLAMFRREASALSRLHHEAIIRYFVFSLDPGLQRHYLAMELVEGEMLSNIVARGSVSLSETAGLLRRLASGLQAAHDRGIVHRDLSPDNIIIETGALERARIIDFGIARSTRLGDTTVIGSGFAGKYNYVSPEQLGLYGGDVTGRSDIYSLGLVIVQCLRGKPIDMAGSQVEVVEKRRSVPDLSDIDGRIRPLLQRMLQPDPANRPESMAEIAAWRLDPAPDKIVPAPAKPAKRAAQPAPRADAGGSSPWKLIAGVGGVGVLAAAAVVGYLQFSGGVAPPPQVPNPQIDRPNPPLQPPQQQATTDPLDRVDEFIRNYDGGDCFLALPTALAPGSAEIDAFGLDRKVFEAMDTAFTKDMGFEAMIDGGQVTQAQCATLQFLRDLRRSAAAKTVRIEIARTAVRTGEVLSGSLIADQPSVVMLVVDEEGKINDVTQQLAPASSGKRFSLRMEKSGGGRPQPVLLVALASNQPVAALRGATGLAQNVYTAALQQATGQGSGIAVAAKYFKLE